MSDRYFITARSFSGGVVIWYVKDRRSQGAGAIVASCNSEADAKLVQDALNEADERRSARIEPGAHPRSGA